MPKDKKNLPKKQAKRGNFPLPVDVIEELRDWKRAYEFAWSDPAPDGEQYTMTNEQLIRRLLEGVKRLDPEVWAAHEAARKSRSEQEGMMADFRRNFWPELMLTRKRVNDFYDKMIGEITGGDSDGGKSDTTSTKEKAGVEHEAVDGAGFAFVKGDEVLRAFPGDRSPFFAVVNGRNVGFREMIDSGWVMLDKSDNVVRDIQEAREIRKTLD